MLSTVLPENSVIQLDGALSADAKYSGVTYEGVYGGTFAYGDLLYLNDADGRWELADANAEATAGLVMLGIAVDAGNDGDTRTIFLYGFFREDDWNWNVGDTLFVHTTAGDMTQTAPSGAADIIRVVGCATDDANTIFFNPSQDWFEHA